MHIELATEENRSRGLGEEEARRRALVAFGGVTQTKEAYRAERTFPRLETVVWDVRYSLRQLRRNRGYTLTVILTLALAIGANTAAFSIVNALLLKRLPYAHPDQLGTISMRMTGPTAFDSPSDINGEQWVNLRDQVPSLDSAIAGISSGVNLETGERAQYVHNGRISAHYLDVLEIHPAAGRNFSEAEDRRNGAKVAILSDRLWRNSFNSDRNLVGKTIRLKSETYTVIVILPKGALTPLDADIYTPLQPRRDGEGEGTNYEPIVRLRDGATWQQADAEIQRAWAGRIRRFAAHNEGAQISFHTVTLQKGETERLRPKALGLLLAAGFILLIACANLAGLMLVRMERRMTELATRMALGASQWRSVQRQLWIESLLLACMGGAAGVGVGFAALRGLLALLPEHFLPVANVPA